ncbi:MAG: hypothetical protein KBT22_09235 [Bacteroidales bacterium]|nr:hypothetical protein [Candidatus Scybalocola fimicaballi]
MAKKAQNTPVEKSIEDRIWESANKLRGKGHDLEAEIRKQLKSIDWEI